MNRKEWTLLAGLIGLFALLYYLPVDSLRFQSALIESFKLVRWYAREHVLLCLVPALFIAGAIGVFVSQSAVMKYFGPQANKLLAYGVASVSGTILAVCSCTVLPLFGGIYMRGAGLGPAIAFLYSGPAINVLAIILTARVLGWQLGLARAIGAVVFSVVIGALMHLIFLKEERARAAAAPPVLFDPDARAPRPLWKTAALFAVMTGILVFANWARSGDIRAVFLCCPNGLTTLQIEGQMLEQTGDHLRVLDADGEVHEMPRAQLQSVAPAHPGAPWNIIHGWRWLLVAVLGLLLAGMVIRWMDSSERREWTSTSWSFAKQIVPLLFAGVLAAGFFLGSPDNTDGGIVPSRWIQALVGNSPAVCWSALGGQGATPGWLNHLWPLWTNLFASFTGALMYFATLTEVPILRGLMDSGMGQGPALALLLAGPALSLPSMLVINSILGPKKTLTYVALVVVMATLTGMGYGWVVGNLE